MKLVALTLTLIIACLSVVVASFFGYEIPIALWAKNFGIGVTFLVALVTVYKKMLVPAAKQVNFISSLFQEIKDTVSSHKTFDFDKLTKDVSYILSDLRPNSGTSMRDAIDRIEMRLIQMEGIHGALHKDGPVAIFRSTSDAKNLEVNRTYCRWLGCTEKDLLGYGWKNFVIDEDDTYTAIWSSAMLEGRELSLQLKLRTVQDEVVICDIHLYPIENRNGNVKEYLGILHAVIDDEVLKAVEIHA